MDIFLRYCNYRRNFCIYAGVCHDRDCIMYRCVLIILSLLLSFPAAWGRKNSPPYNVRKHEVAFSGAIYPGRYAFGYDFSLFGRDRSGYPYSLSGIYHDAVTYNKERVTDTWSLSYTYNFTEIFALSASLSYEGGWNEYYSRADDSRISVFGCHYLTPMVTARFSWLNRGLVRMYSSAGAGVAVSFADMHNTVSGSRRDRSPDASVSLQLTPVGISVGRSLFGFFELGVGTIYVGGCFGIGYRF